MFYNYLLCDLMIGLAFLNHHHVHQLFHMIFSFTLYGDSLRVLYYIYPAIAICLSFSGNKLIAHAYNGLYVGRLAVVRLYLFSQVANYIGNA